MLRVENLTKMFGGLKAVDDVSFEVPKGIICGLIGPNGSGKTTLFNLITGFLSITSGKVFFHEQPIGGKPAYQIAQIGITRTFQMVRVFQRMTVMENMLLGYKMHAGEEPWVSVVHGHSYTQADKKAIAKAFDLLDVVGMRKLANVRAENLPYAEQKMVEIARSLMGNPELIMLDEPASGINPTLVNQVLDYIRLILSQGDKTFIIVEHDMRVIMNLCDHIIVLNHGAKIAEGTPAEVSGNKDVIDAYLGGG
jgi:ABC-type branched-subunit amino acid transport system ATPase component